MSTTPSVIIVGAGISGLTCALALQQRGLRPLVLEQSAQLLEVGAGLQISPNASSVLCKLGLQQALLDKASLPQGIRSLHWRSGADMTQVPFAELGFHSPYIHLHRADLQQVLLDAVQANDPDCIRTGQHVEAVISEEGRSTLVVRHGETFRADWVIGADGIRSRCRDYVVNDNALPHFTGNVAWRGLLPTEQVPKSLRPGRWANLWMGPGGHVVVYYLRGGEMINFVAVREQADWQEESWNAPASLRDLLHDFADWDPTLFELLSYADPKTCFRWALFDRDPIEMWHRDQLVLIGDAAHPMLPFLAQGAAMGIEDAWVLSELIAKGGTDIGARYQALRAPRCSRVQQLARDNMRLFHHHSPVIRAGRDLVAKGLSKMSPAMASRRVAWIYQWQAKDDVEAAQVLHS